MRLKKIFIRGFKSFAEPVWLEFPYNFSVVIGPNGSGKSNIVDAIKWVLGERRTSQFRTSSLKDVLFKGSATRGPASVAEVSVFLDNSDKSFPLEAEEVVLTRRISRDGLSTFMVNGAEVRMRDVHALLWDTGLFKGGYTIIEQDQITRLAVQDPHELRTLIEEAAGITRFKLRQKESVARIKELETELQPLKEKLALMEAELKSLEEEVEKERKFRELDRKIREGHFRIKSYEYHRRKTNAQKHREKSLELEDEIHNHIKRIEELRRNIAQIEAEAEKENLTIEELQKKIEEEKVREARRKEKLKNLKEKLQENAHKKEKLKAQLESLNKNIESEEGKLKTLSSKMDLAEKEFQKAKEEIAKLTSQINEKAEEEFRYLERKVSSLSTAITRTVKERNRLKNRIEEAKKKLEESKKELENTRTDEVSLERLKDSLKKFNQEIEKVQSDLKNTNHDLNLLKRERAHIHRLIERTTAKGTLASLIRISHENLEKETLEKLESALSGFSHLRIEGEIGEVITGPFDKPRDENIIRYIKVLATGESEEKLKKFLSQFSIEDADNGFFTIKGITFFPKGEENPLKLKRELEELEKHIEVLEKNKAKLEKELQEKKESVARLTREYQEKQRKQTYIKSKREKLEREIFSLEKQIAIFRKDLEEIEESLKQMQEEKESVEEKLRYVQKRAEENRRIREKRRELYSYANHLEKQLTNMEKEAGITEAKILQYRATLQNIHKEIQNIEVNSEEITRIIEELKNENTTADLESLEKRLEERKKVKKNLENTLSEIREELSSLRTKVEILKKEKESSEEKAKFEEEKASSIFNDIKENYPDRLPQQVDKEEAETLRKLIKSWENSLKNLGSVNLSASRIYADINKRYQTLRNEVEDMEQSREKLLEIIEAAQKEAKKAFLATLSEISRDFNYFLRRLFEGGDGSVKVKGDILEGPVELNVRIPGKKIDSIQLFSGGERALVAIAFIFSLLKAKPVPFVIMDEVDAPLDEANISRFLNLVKEFSQGKFTKPIQFIIITHNKKTMSAAEVLYGITMEEKGISKVFSVDLEATSS